MNDLVIHAPILPQVGIAGVVDTNVVATSSVPQPRLIRAAHEFEAAMMKELMAPLSPGHNSLDGGDDGGSSSAISEFAGEALGKALSEHGGFGIAKSIIDQLSHKGPKYSGESNHSGNSPVPGIRGRNPTNSPSK